MHGKWKAAAIAVSVVLATSAACSSDGDETEATSTTAMNTSAAVAGFQEPSEDVLTPLLVSPLGDPIPFRGTDGMVHVVYELQVFNASPRDATLTAISTVADDEVVHRLEGEELVERTLVLGPLDPEPKPATSIPTGRTAAVLVDDTYPDTEAVPATFAHQLEATFAPVVPGMHPFASQYPDTVDEVVGEMRIGEGEPVVIGPPLAGPDWLAMNACCSRSAHRGAMLPLNGRVNASERYAIDWVRVNRALGPADIGDSLLPTFDGDPATNDAYLAYGEPLLAVADGTVVAVVDGLVDQTPQALAEGIGLKELGGNHLVIDIGDGLFAFYAHVQPGSFDVAVGDKVTKGQVVGLLGNSGNTSEPHLHFHVSRGPTPLAATQWPYEIEAFELEGTMDGETRMVVASPSDGPVTRAMPLALDVVTFPAR